MSAAILILVGPGCALLRPAPALFASAHDVEELDFEQDPLNRPPGGLAANSERWTVVDSPTAVSGTQVLVRRGDRSSVAEIKTDKTGARVGGEVSIRVLLGPSGAGIACDSGDSSGYVLNAEPEARRVALYRRTDASTTLVTSATAPIEKGKWVRLGILCENDLVVGYVDGKAVIEKRASVGRSRLALYADEGVTAQFDNFRYAVQDSAEN